MATDDMSDRAVRIARFEVIFHEHDPRSDLQDECLGCETSFFQSLDERK